MTGLDGIAKIIEFNRQETTVNCNRCGQSLEECRSVLVSAVSARSHQFPQFSTAQNPNPVTDDLDRGYGKCKLGGMHELLSNGSEATRSVALPFRGQVPAAQDFIGIPPIFESQLIENRNPKLMDEQFVTLTPYSPIFCEQVLAAQDFADTTTMSRAQLHENKDFRNQQEKNVLQPEGTPKQKGRPRGSA